MTSAVASAVVDRSETEGWPEWEPLDPDLPTEKDVWLGLLAEVEPEAGSSISAELERLVSSSPLDAGCVGDLVGAGERVTSAVDRLLLARAWDRVASAAQAVAARTFVDALTAQPEHGAWQEMPAGDGPGVISERVLAGEAQALFCRTSREHANAVMRARRWVDRCPLLLREMEQGRAGFGHVYAFTVATGHLSDEDAREVDRRLSGRAVGRSVAAYRPHVGRAIQSLALQRRRDRLAAPAPDGNAGDGSEPPVASDDRADTTPDRPLGDQDGPDHDDASADCDGEPTPEPADLGDGPSGLSERQLEEMIGIRAIPLVGDLAEVQMVMPAAAAMELLALIRDTAWVSKLKDDPRTAGQRQIQALLDLVHGLVNVDPATGEILPETTGQARRRRRGRRRTEVHATIDLLSLLRLHDDPGNLAGYGPVSAAAVREMLGQPGTVLRRIVTDPVTGQVVDYSVAGYVPDDAMRRMIDVRDQTCRYPGCNRRSAFCDFEHVIAWSTGHDTSMSNCGLLCAEHHALKTDEATTYRRPDPGSGDTEWVTALGLRYRRTATTITRDAGIDTGVSTLLPHDQDECVLHSTHDQLATEPTDDPERRSDPRPDRDA